LIIALAFSALFIVLAFLEPTAFMRGLLLGAGLATIACGLCFLVLTHDGSYTWRRGAEAEELTAELLERQLPRWKMVHGIFLVSADVDHVVVGPGGVVAVETKWTTVEWENHHGKKRDYRAALAQARLSAERVQRLLSSKDISTHVLAMLVVWGRGAPHFREGTQMVDGVLVVEGRADPDLSRHIQDVHAFDVDPVLSALTQQR
jgi:hypothetical protein